MIGSKGYLDVADQYVASGWALLAISSEPAVVEIYVNEKLYTSIRANAAREDLSELGLGDCAFTVEFNPPLQPGSRIRARVAGDVVDLVNSPQIAL
jgi:hypothetical protein